MSSVAARARRMRLKIGDTIEGKESNGRYWNITRLTVLWIGKSEVVWMETHASSENPKWSKPRETARWVLCCRRWKKVTQ